MKRLLSPPGIALVSITCCLILTMGCGGGGVERHNLSGEVTFQGKPVPSGRIIFEPDNSKGNDGPQGVASIENGSYSTDKFGKGAVSGALIVRIVGFDKAPPAGTPGDDQQGGASPRPLFPTYTTQIELGKEDSTFDFKIPASVTR